MKKRGSKAVSTLLAAALLVSLAGPGEWVAAAESSAAENSQVTQSAHGSEGAGGDGAGAGANAPKRRIAPPKQTPSILEAAAAGADAAGTGGSTGQALLAADNGLGIAAQNLPQAVVGSPYSAAIAVYGGEPPYGFAAEGLPNGLDLDAQNGKITGTPAAGTEGTHEIKVTLTDSAAEPSRAEAVLQLTVAAGQKQAPWRTRCRSVKSLLIPWALQTRTAVSPKSSNTTRTTESFIW